MQEIFFFFKSTKNEEKNTREKEREITFCMWKTMYRMERELYIYSKRRGIKKVKNEGR